MMNQGSRVEKGIRVILYCRSAKSDNTELQEQKNALDEYADANGLVVVFTYM